MFKDYYSILGISFPSNNEEIRQAYCNKVEALGTDSSKCSSPDYQRRVDVEVAFRVLGASYSLKAAYDEEYQQYTETPVKDCFEIKDDWTKSQIKSEIDFVVNRILEPVSTYQGETERKGIGSKAIGCVGKILGFIFLIIVIAGVKTCARKQVRNSFKNSYIEPESKDKFTISSNNNSEIELQKAAREINQTLPRQLDSNITHQAISLSSSALVYEYIVDDNFFSKVKDQALSLDNQLANIRMMYSDMKPMIDLLIETNRGISYKYICKTSKNTNIVSVSCDDLRTLFSKRSKSTTFNYNDLYSIEIPNILELKQSELNNLEHLKDNTITVTTSSGNIIFQQKGVNDVEKTSLNKYCRIIIEYFPEDRNEPTYGCGDQIVVDKDVFYEINNTVEKNCEASGTPLIKLISVQPLSINDYPVLYYSYKRKGWEGKQPPVIVNVFRIFNLYESVTLTFSYRESEREEWKSIHDYIINTFTFSERYYEHNESDLREL